MEPVPNAPPQRGIDAWTQNSASPSTPFSSVINLIIKSNPHTLGSDFISRYTLGEFEWDMFLSPWPSF